MQVTQTDVDDDTEEILEVPMFICSNCHAKREEAPTPIGRFRCVLQDGYTTAEVLCGPKLTDMLAGRRPACAWGKPGDAQRAALLQSFSRFLNREYRCTISVTNKKLYLNGFNDIKRPSLLSNSDNKRMRT